MQIDVARARIPVETSRPGGVEFTVQVGVGAGEVPPSAVVPRNAVVTAVVSVQRAERLADVVRQSVVGCKRSRMPSKIKSNFILSANKFH